jgi:hypothetical protein
MRLVQRLTAASLRIVAAPLCGVGLGVLLVYISPHQSAPLWSVWAALALAQCVVAGALYVYGARRWTDLVALRALRVRDVAVPAAALVVVFVVAINMPWLLLPRHDHGGWSSLYVQAPTTAVVLASLPLVGVLFGVRQVASGEPLPSAAGGRLALLIALRRLLHRILATASAVVALVTLQFGARAALDRSVHSVHTVPPQYLLVYGGVGSLLVAVSYVPGWTALQRGGKRLCDELFPMDGLDEASAVLSMAGHRQSLEQALGVDRSVLSDLQTGLAIVAPLFASAAAALLNQ